MDVSDDLNMKRSSNSALVVKMKPLLVNVPLSISCILAGSTEICFSVFSDSFAGTRIEPIEALSRSFAPEAPAVCQFTPVAERFQLACVSLKGTFKRYILTVVSLLDKSSEVHKDRVAETMVASAGMEERSNLIKLRAKLLVELIFSPIPKSADVP